MANKILMRPVTLLRGKERREFSSCFQASEFLDRARNTISLLRSIYGDEFDLDGYRVIISDTTIERIKKGEI